MEIGPERAPLCTKAEWFNAKQYAGRALDCAKAEEPKLYSSLARTLFYTKAKWPNPPYRADGAPNCTKDESANSVSGLKTDLMGLLLGKVEVGMARRCGALGLVTGPTSGVDPAFTGGVSVNGAGGTGH